MLIPSAMVLWTIFAILTAAALSAVLWPFLRAGDRHIEAAAYDAAVFQDQLEEIGSEVERGVISGAEAEAARTEISRRLLALARADDSNNAKSVDKRDRNIPALAMICAFICVPFISGALYIAYGSPQLPDSPLAARLNKSGDEKKIEALVARVEARLRQHPEEARGWEVLAPVYMRQRRFAEAASAYGRALRLLGKTPKRSADLGIATVFANGGVVSEPARVALQSAVTGDPSLVEAHFWLAVAKEQDGRISEAINDWRALLQRGDAGAPWRRVVKQRLAELEQREGVPPAEKAELKGPAREDIIAAQDMKPSDRAAMIKQMVAGLAERLKNDGGDVEEWKRLVRSYGVLGKQQAARKALDDARQAYAQDSSALASLSELANQLGL